MLPGNSLLYYEDKAFLSKQQCIILSNNYRNIFSYKVTASFKDLKRSKKKPIEVGSCQIYFNKLQKGVFMYLFFYTELFNIVNLVHYHEKPIQFK